MRYKLKARGNRYYFGAFLCAAHRFFCPAAIRAFASGLSTRFTGLVEIAFLGLPGPFFTEGVGSE